MYAQQFLTNEVSAHVLTIASDLDARDDVGLIEPARERRRRLQPDELTVDAQPIFALETEAANTQSADVFAEEATRIAATMHPALDGYRLPGRQ